LSFALRPEEKRTRLATFLRTTPQRREYRRPRQGVLGVSFVQTDLNLEVQIGTLQPVAKNPAKEIHVVLDNS
jgi:hypothetical protein